MFMNEAKASQFQLFSYSAQEQMCSKMLIPCAKSPGIVYQGIKRDSGSCTDLISFRTSTQVLNDVPFSKSQVLWPYS